MLAEGRVAALDQASVRARLESLRIVAETPLVLSHLSASSLHGAHVRWELWHDGPDGRVLERFSPRTAPDDATVIQAIEKAAGKEAILDLLPMQPGDVPDTFADSSALENYVNYKPETSVVNGVKNFVDWYRQYHNI